MVQSAPAAHQPASVQDDDEEEFVDISPTRGGGHVGHMLAFFVAAQLAPVVSILIALACLSGGAGDQGWMWAVVGVVGVPAALLFGGALFLAEHGLEVDERPEA